jgi:hypothetical protein
MQRTIRHNRRNVITSTKICVRSWSLANMVDCLPALALYFIVLPRLIDPALREITTASPLLHHLLGHDPRCQCMMLRGTRPTSSMLMLEALYWLGRSRPCH